MAVNILIKCIIVCLIKLYFEKTVGIYVFEIKQTSNQFDFIFETI